VIFFYGSGEELKINREWLLAAGSIVLTIATSLLLLRWLAPQLLGIPVDLQLVQTGKTIPPFYEGVFREQDYAGDSLILNDPYTIIRFRPLLPENGGTGPHDVLGFRNTCVPNSADIITLGDSQTYGMGEPLRNNWPSQLAGYLQQAEPAVYSMAVGGWGAVQYLDMFPKAAKLGPKTVIIAFYSGNDPLESFSMAYGNDQWASLRPDPDLRKSDAPKKGNLLDVENTWSVTFSDGIKAAFTPKGRLMANDNTQPAVQAGYDIMVEVVRRITAMAVQYDITPVFTVIPTRELVYSRKVEREGLPAPETYQRLIRMEKENIDALAREIQAIPAARYVDLVEPLQTAALSDTALYPRKWDGHPGQAGYRLIAGTLAATINGF